MSLSAVLLCASLASCITILQEGFLHYRIPTQKMAIKNEKDVVTLLHGHARSSGFVTSSFKSSASGLVALDDEIVEPRCGDKPAVC